MAGPNRRVDRVQMIASPRLVMRDGKSPNTMRTSFVGSKPGKQYALTKCCPFVDVTRNLHTAPPTAASCRVPADRHNACLPDLVKFWAEIHPSDSMKALQNRLGSITASVYARSPTRGESGPL